jgi:hypothetical protein
MNPLAQFEMMKLVLSWMLIGAFVLTALVTLLALVGFLGLLNHQQLTKLIYMLVAEIVIAAITFPLGVFQPAPGVAVNRIEKASRQAAVKLEQENTAAVSEQNRLHGELLDTKRQLAASVEKATAYDQQIAQANENAQAQNKTISQLHDLIQRASPPQPPTASADEVNALKTRVEKAEAELAESRQLEETMHQRLKDIDSKSTAVDESRREKARQLQRAKTIGRILAVNPGWNFVVLSIGDKQGVTPDSTLLVLRGGAQIAKVRVKSIEPNQSIADVIPSTVRRGQTVKPGDNVVFEEVRPQPTPAPQPPQPLTHQAALPPDSALPPLPSPAR